MRKQWTLLLFLFLCIPCHAQNVTSTLNGVVIDESGAPIPAATCKLTDLRTATVFQVVSEQTGLFTFPAVAAGRYTLEIQAKGFKSLSVDNIVLIACERPPLRH